MGNMRGSIFPNETSDLSWSLEKKCFGALGTVFFSGQVDLFSLVEDPALSSLQESYGEDPFFSGKMGAAVVNGVQRCGVNDRLVGGLEHFLFSHILGIIIPTD